MNQPRTNIKRFLAVGAVVLAGLLPLSTQAQDARQYKLEAAFLYNFFNYITWPGMDSPEAMDKASICLEAGDPLENSLAYVQRKMASQRALTIREWHSGDSAKGCNLLFVRDGGPLVNEPGTLTVTDGRELRGGAMVALKQEEGRIGMRINNSLLTEHGFTASSRLLTLAQEVK